MDEPQTEEQRLRVALSEAYKASGLTLQELIDRSGLKLTIVSLSRKLRGRQMLRLDEARSLAGAMGLSLSYQMDEAKAAEVATAEVA